MLNRRISIALVALFGAVVLLWKLNSSMGNTQIVDNDNLLENLQVSTGLEETMTNLKKATERPVVVHASHSSASTEIKVASTNSGYPMMLNGYRSIIDPNEPLKMNCTTCSLVSSSGRILGQSKGAEIDGADCVLRMNIAPVKGYEGDVGKRTTARILSQFSVKFARNQLLAAENLRYFIAWGGNVHLGQKTANYKKMLEKAIQLPNIGFFRSSEEYYWYQDKVFENITGRPRQKSGTWLSTGWFTFDVIKNACKRTKVYGMIPEVFCRDPTAPKALYHYWDPNAGDECAYYSRMENMRAGAHRFMTEKAIFARWALQHSITFHSPDWDPKLHTEAHHKF
eukprot:m.311493 g.311493  ORF g.311493 m.311493 type:complete len:340 (+) comp73227_c0_seq1:46-1065(+)